MGEVSSATSTTCATDSVSEAKYRDIDEGVFILLF